jgi:hypothetical protein
MNGVYHRIEVDLSAAAFGCFERIHFLGCGFGGRNMGRQVAIPDLPFQGRIRASGAKPAGCIFSSAVTAVAFLYDLVANPAVV